MRHARDSAPSPATAETIRDLSWYLDAMHVEDAQRLTEGEGVTVAVVDTGVDSSHADLQGQVLSGGEVGAHDSGSDGRDDKDGHGTGMASLIAGKGNGANSILGVAPKAKILPVRIAQTSDGSFQPSDVYEGVRWAIDHGANVVNMSLGGERSTDAPWKRQLVEYATRKNAVLIAAAGNTGQGDKRVAEPASIPGVVAVSGITRDGTFWDGSAKGPEVVVSAPAEDLPMAVPRSVSASGYALADGTSGATALVSGVAALIRSAFPDASSSEVINRLIQTAEDHGRPGRDEEYGYGVVDARAALEGNVPSVDHDPLVSPEADKSDAPAAAGGGRRDTGNQALLVVGVFIGTATVLLAAAYLVHLARRSRQVVLAGVAPAVGPVPLGGGVTWAGPPHPQWPASHHPSVNPYPPPAPGYVSGGPPAYHAMPYPGQPVQPQTQPAPLQPPLPGTPSQPRPVSQPAPPQQPVWRPPDAPPASSVWPADMPTSVSATPVRPPGSASAEAHAAPAHALQSAVPGRRTATEQAQSYSGNSVTQQMPVISAATPPVDPGSRSPKR